MFPTRMFPLRLFPRRMFPRPAAVALQPKGPTQFRSLSQRLGPDPSKTQTEPA